MRHTIEDASGRYLTMRSASECYTEPGILRMAIGDDIETGQPVRLDEKQVEELIAALQEWLGVEAQ